MFTGHIASVSWPSVGRTPTEETLHYHRRIDGLRLLVELVPDADSRCRVAKAIREEGRTPRILLRVLRPHPSQMGTLDRPGMTPGTRLLRR